MKTIQKGLAGLFACVCLLGGCTEQKPDTWFYDYSSYQAKENGWTSYLIKEVVFEDQEEIRTHYTFNGTNLKYKNMNDFYTHVYGEDKNEVTQSNTSIPSYSAQPELKKDVDAINNCLNQNTSDTASTIQAIQALDLNYFKTEDLVSLYEQVQENTEMKRDGNYHLAEANCKQSELLDGGVLQVSYICLNGYLQQVNIENIDANGNYLSDTNSSMQQQIDQLEQTIVTTQSYENATITDASEEWNASLQTLLKETFSK